MESGDEYESGGEDWDDGASVDEDFTPTSTKKGKKKYTKSAGAEEEDNSDNELEEWDDEDEDDDFNEELNEVDEDAEIIDSDEEICDSDELDPRLIMNDPEDRPDDKMVFDGHTIKKIIVVKPENRITSNILQMNEITRIISIRAKEIDKGAPVFTDVEGLSDPIHKAAKELFDGRCPLVVRRRRGNTNLYEDWNIVEDQMGFSMNFDKGNIPI